MKAYITKEQAKSILPDGEYIHTFYNGNLGLVGADWSRTEILDKIERSDVLELTGEVAKSMSHGMCAHSKDAKYQDEILFIQTDEERLCELEAASKGKRSERQRKTD